MEQEVVEILLNEMPLNRFVGFFLVGALGGLLFFLWNLYTGITKDPNTPYTWSWRAFTRGAIRVVVSLISLAFVILNFEDLSTWLFSLPDGQMAELNVKSAFLLGIGIDGIVKKLMSAGIGGYQTMKRMKS